MDKLLDNGVDVNLVDKVGSLFVHCDAYPKFHPRTNAVNVADTGWFHLSSQSGNRQKGGCH
jgi:hypothetical protein